MRVIIRQISLPGLGFGTGLEPVISNNDISKPHLGNKRNIFFPKKSDNEISLKAKFFTDYYLTTTLCFYTQMKTITTCFSYFTAKTKILSSCLYQRMHLLQFSHKHPEKICFSKTFFDFGCLKIITTKVSIAR